MKCDDKGHALHRTRRLPNSSSLPKDASLNKFFFKENRALVALKEERGGETSRIRSKSRQTRTTILPNSTFNCH